MSKSFSKFISLIFHPLLIPFYMGLMVVFLHPLQFPDYKSSLNEYQIFNRDIKLIVYFALMVVFPLFSIFLMKKLELIESYTPSDSKQRFIPLIAIGTFWLWTYIMFKEGAEYQTASYAPLGYTILGCVISVFIIFPLNSILKFNFHLIGVGALNSLILNIITTSPYNLTFLLIISILITGLVASAQLSLHNSDKNDLLTGFLIGFIGQFLAFNIIPQFL